MGILGLSNTLAKEGAKYNINVNCVVPVAESKMTQTILPPHILSMLQPEHIAPFVAFLAHENTQVTGGVYEVGAGWYSQVRWERSSGAFLGSPQQPASLESIRDQFERIGDFTASSHPTQISDSLRDMLSATTDPAAQSSSSSAAAVAAAAIIRKVNNQVPPVAAKPILQSDHILSTLQHLLQLPPNNSAKIAELVEKVACSVQFHIRASKETTSVTKKWLVNLTTVSSAFVREVDEKVDGRSDVLVKCTDEVFMFLVKGKLSPEYAYFRGDLQVKGSPQQVMKVKSLIEYSSKIN